MDLEQESLDEQLLETPENKPFQYEYKANSNLVLQSDRKKLKIEEQFEEMDVRTTVSKEAGEENIEEVRRMINNMRDLSMNMGSEIEAQNKQIDRINKKACFSLLKNIKYCDVPGSPCLSEKGESNVRFVSF